MSSNERIRLVGPGDEDAKAENGDCGCGGGPPGPEEPDDSGDGADNDGMWATIAAIPSVVLPLLPSFTCPMCLAAYSGILSAAGLGVVLKASVLQPLIAVFLVAQVASVGWTTRSHDRPEPLLSTIAGAGAVAGGRLIYDIPFL
ncbi:MAG: hypothetical protein ABEN55_23980, partial [Bradymonadaceae bacterium]